MDKIKNLLNFKLLNILSNIQRNNHNLLTSNINNYVSKNLINLNKNKEYDNVREILLYLLSNDGNFLLVNKNLKDIEIFIKKKYKLETNEDEINNIIIEFLEKRI
tara:strand:- start:3033 stop:3347 length:315 start_codon:yes stop_codon:yes gene_type:complete